MEFLLELKSRNELLFYFGIINFILAIFFIMMSFITEIQVMNINAWHKPTKFALSICIYVLTIAWYLHYLPDVKQINLISILIVLMLGFEIII